MAKRGRSTIGEDPLDVLIPYGTSADDAEDIGEDSDEQGVFGGQEADKGATGGAAAARAKSKRARGDAHKRADRQSASTRPGRAETARDLERMNKEMQVRIRELEFELAGGAGDDGADAAQDAVVSEESDSIISMVKDLHGEIDAVYELKDALEADLGVAKDKLGRELEYRAEMEARMKLLEAKAALGEQLREDISFVEEERNETARRLEQTTSQFEQVTAECDGLTARAADFEVHIKHIQSEKLGLEAKVLNLEETVGEMDRLRGELADAAENGQILEESVRNVKGSLEATETAKNALELDLATTREIVRSHSDQIEELKEELAGRHAEVADLRGKLDRQEIDNVNLQEAKKRWDREVKTLTSRVETVKKELDLSKRALRDIRSAAVRTTGRVRERYSKP